MASLVRVIIASRVRLYRESLALLPGSRTGVEVVGWARGPDDALAGVEETEPDVLLLDLTMEGDSEQVRRLVQQVRVPVVILGVEDYDAHSSPKRTLIPGESGHRFQSKGDTQSS